MQANFNYGITKEVISTKPTMCTAKPCTFTLSGKQQETKFLKNVGKTHKNSTNITVNALGDAI